MPHASSQSPRHRCYGKASMGDEIDHIFVMTNAGAPDADDLVRLGLTEGAPNRHEGQGTANRRFFFDNAMLELLWVENVDQARSRAVAPLRLADRWTGRSSSACPFGICLRPSDAETRLPPFRSFEYRPAYFPEGLVIHVARGLSLAEPLWFYIIRSRDLQASSQAQLPATRHRLGVRRITEVAVTLPSTPSPASCAASSVCGVKLRTGSQHRLRIAFDGGMSGRTHLFGPKLPMEFCW